MIGVGTQLGPYKITALLGEGGMGVVFRARDTKLQRDVALKRLPEHFADDPDRLARFQREAQVLASLNHPNIAQIYGLEESDRTPCIVMELIEGETLQERLRRGPIPIDEALPIARHIAEALEAAHERGIIHRDLKPANVKIAPDGKVKVLDFGLAKVFQPQQGVSLSNSPTMMSASVPGAILGTAAYMSPEQAKGKDADRASDMWAFGCVLCEMLTGKAVFDGETAGEILAEIFKSEPDWSRLPADTPDAIRRLLRLCLKKDRDRRVRSAHDARIEIDDAISTPAGAVQAAPAAPAKAGAYGVALLIVAIVIGVALWFRTPAAPSQVWSGTLLGGPAIAYGPRISPDGKMLAFQALIDGQSQVGVMNVKSGNWTLLTHEKNGGFLDYVEWSPDGTKIYFSRNAGAPVGVFTIPALGGEERLLLDNADFPQSLPDGSLLVDRFNSNRQQQLYRFKPETGDVQPLNASLSDLVASVPTTPFRAFPDGARVVFFGRPADPSFINTPARLYLLDLKTNQARRIGPELGISATSCITVNPIDGTVLVNVQSGDVRQILSISTDGRTPTRALMTLTDVSGYMDMAADGSLYLDQLSRPMQVLRFSEAGQQPEAKAIVPLGAARTAASLELPDGRFLLTTFFDGRARLLVAKSTGELMPFVDTEDETQGPAALVGSGQIAFMTGRAPEQSIAIASIKDGRVLQRRRIKTNDFVTSLTASSDGNTLFYSDAGSIWSIPVNGGDARKLGPGDAVSFDPLHQNLVVQLNEKDGVRLARMAVTGGATEPIPMQGTVRIPPQTWLGPHAVRQDGKIAVGVASRDSWFFGAGIVDPVSGTIRKIPLQYDGDLFSLSWNQKAQIVTSGFIMRSAIWRFRRQMPAYQE